MKKKIISTMITATLIMGLILTGCTDVLGPPNSQPEGAGAKGYVQLKLASANGRTLLPTSYVFTSFKLTFTPESGTAVVFDKNIISGHGEYIELDPGPWSLAAVFSDDDKTVATASASNILIEEREYTPVILQLIFEKSLTGTGVFDWNIAVAGAHIATMTLSNLSTNAAATNIDLLAAGASAKSQDLSVGYYLVTVTLEKDLIDATSGANRAVWSDILHVYPKQTTILKLSDFAYFSGISQVWIDDASMTAETDGTFTFTLPDAQKDATFAINLTSDASGAKYIPAAGGAIAAANDEYDIVFVAFEETPEPGIVTEWTFADNGDYDLTVDPIEKKLTVVYAPSTYTVTFYDGTVNLGTVQVPKGGKVGAGDFPLPHYTVTWKDNSGAFDANTPVNSDLDVIVNTKTFVGGTPRVEGNTVVHDYPLLQTNASNAGGQGTWTGNIKADGSVTWTNGAIRYLFPTTGTGYNIADYDFFTITYSTGSGSSLVWKQYNNGTDYGYLTANTQGFVSSPYPTLDAGGDTFKFQIRGAGTTGGIALQAHSNTTERSIHITKITFTKGTRHTVTLDPDGGNVSPTSVVVLETTTIGAGTLPTPTKTGYNFVGWYQGSTAVTDTTEVTASFNNAALTAHWQQAATNVQPKNVTFTSSIFRPLPTTAGEGPTITILSNGTGFEYKYGSKNYGSSLAPFTITLDSGITLADYDTIECDFVGLDGDATYKNFNVYAASGTSMIVDSTAFTVSQASKATNNGNFNHAPVKLTFDIDKAKANLSGSFEIAFQGSMNNVGNGSNGTNTNTTRYSISNVVLKKAEQYVVNNPQFTGWGGSNGTKNIFDFDVAATNNCRITYDFPVESGGYTHFEVTYGLTRSTNANNAATMPNWSDRSMKVVVNDRSKDNWATTDATIYVDYKESSTNNSSMTFSHAITANKQFTFEHNTDADGSTSFTITVTKIRFYNE